MAFTIQRGTNISHWLSQSKLDHEQRETFFTADDVKRLADWGFDHLRLPIDEAVMYDEAGGRDARSFEFLDRALDWAAASGMRVIVDLHILRSHHFLEEAPKLYREASEVERFVELWRDLSAAMSGRPNEQVAYELMNEPKAPDNGTWNEVWRAVYGALREREAGRTIVVEPNWFGITPNAPDLSLPADEGLMVSFHFYSPMAVTHYRASWSPPHDQYEGPVTYPGRPMPGAAVAAAPEAFQRFVAETDLNAPFDQQSMRALLEPVLRLRARTGVRLHCGEFGVRTIVPLEVRRAWHSDLVALFHEYEIAYANWDYRGGFGIVDRSGEPTGIHDILLR